MASLLRVLLVAAYLAATAFACPVPGASTQAPELARAYSANALHAHGAQPEGRAGDSRARPSPTRLPDPVPKLV